MSFDPTDRQQHRIYDLKQLLEIPEPEDEWLVEPMVPLGGRTFAFGQGSTYKTEIMLDLSMAVASGGRMLNQFDVKKHGPVMINSTEGTLHGMKRRVVRQLRARPYVNPATFYDQYYFCPEPFRIEDPVEFDELRRALDHIQPIFLLLDPLDSFLEGNENSPSETRIFRRRMDRIIGEHRERNMSVAIIHHSPVSTSERMRGTSAWRNWADAALQYTVVERHFGLDRPKKVLTVNSSKQRDDDTGHLFTVVPLYDNRYSLTNYAIYDGQDDAEVIESWFRQQVYGLLRDSDKSWTNRMLMDQLKVGNARLARALEQLSEQGLVDKAGVLERPTKTDGSRTRAVPAWRAIVQVPFVDSLMVLAKAEAAEADAQAQHFDISPALQPVPTGGDVRAFRFTGDGS